MNKIRLRRVSKPREILEASGLAHTIWREHYASIISPGQIEYMLAEFQSPAAIERAIAEGSKYFIARRLGVSVGYLCVKFDEPEGSNSIFLSKFYLLKEYRGKGFARDMIAQLCEIGARLRLRSIWLTVNKNNASVQAYERLGFRTIREQVNDIGGGYVMDDYVMELDIPPKTP